MLRLSRKTLKNKPKKKKNHQEEPKKMGRCIQD